MNDVEWLIGQAPSTDLLERQGNVVGPIIDILKKYAATDPARRASSVTGLFGGWGCGKTSTLALLAQRLGQARPDVPKALRSSAIVYINAWKIAGRQEIIPTVIYAILTAIASAQQDKTQYRQIILECLSLCGSALADTVNRVTEPIVGVKVADAVTSSLAVKRGLQDIIQRRDERLLDDYFGQVSRLQEILRNACAQFPRPIVVMIDELDRCDPDEAFEVFKQLRSLFGLRGAHVNFIISVNQEPIGTYIRHKFGFGVDDNQFESHRILEKFVDEAVIADAPTYLHGYIEQLCHDSDITPDRLSLIMKLDRQVLNRENLWGYDTMRNALAERIDTSISLYSNLRVLTKCWRSARVKAARADTQRYFWAIWHLEILNQIDPNFRSLIRDRSSDIVWCALGAYAAVLHRIRSERGSFDFQTEEPLFQDWDKGATAFAAYRSIFYEKMRERLDWHQANHISGRQVAIEQLEGILNRTDRMEVVIQCTLINPPVDSILNQSVSNFSDHGLFVPEFSRFGYILHRGYQ